MKSLFEESDLSDVIFEIGMHKCHSIRALFAIHSPVFKSMLYGNVILRDMTREIFACLRSFFYGFNANINHKNVIGLFYHSDKYLITPLKNECMICRIFVYFIGITNVFFMLDL
ncbi:MAG: BTB/POZ domain-containing protein [Ketobacter sp.]|nr:BTB/POZ domain-containing protein [Ketobacter sp.]